jgi:hypothetical protein
MDDMDALARACAVGMGTGPRYLDGAQHHAHRAVRRRGREGCVQAALPDHRGSSMSCRSRSRVSAVWAQGEREVQMTCRMTSVP